MTAAHPVASRSPDRTGLRRAGRSVPSQCEMVTGPGFSSPNQPDQERTTAYRDSSGSDSRSDALRATIVGDWEEPSGESRLMIIDYVDVLGPIVRPDKADPVPVTYRNAVLAFPVSAQGFQAVSASERQPFGSLRARALMCIG